VTSIDIKIADCVEAMQRLSPGYNPRRIDHGDRPEFRVFGGESDR
jgi:hypothetical protein